MAQKRINYVILEAKEQMLQMINQMIQTGVPVAVIELMMINLSTSIGDTVKQVVQKEQELYYEEIQQEENNNDETS